MRKFFSLVLACMSTLASATVTVSGNVQDLSTANAARSFVRFNIRGCNGNQPRVTGTAIIIPLYQDFAPTAGAFSGTLYDSLTEISCGGSVGNTWYGVSVYRDGKPGPEVPYNVTGASFNLNSATPNTTSPVVSAPTGDSTYFRLDAGNIITGSPLPSTNGTQALGSTSARWDLFANDIDTNSFLKMRQLAAPACLASIGFFWYDSSADRFTFCENNGSAIRMLRNADSTQTWGGGSTITWTFDASAGTDTTIAFGNNTQTFTAGTITLSGTTKTNTISANTNADVAINGFAGSNGTVTITAGGTTTGKNASLIGGSASAGVGGDARVTGGTGVGTGGDVVLTPGFGGSNQGRLTIPEQVAPPVGAAATAALYVDSTAHKLELSLNAGSYFPVAQVVASGTSTLTSSAVNTGVCATVVTTAATGTATTDSIQWAYASAPTAPDGKLILNVYPTANNVNFLLCNPGAGSLTPTGLVVNWRVIR